MAAASASTCVPQRGLEWRIDEDDVEAACIGARRHGERIGAHDVRLFAGIQALDRAARSGSAMPGSRSTSIASRAPRDSDFESQRAGAGEQVEHARVRRAPAAAS